MGYDVVSQKYWEQISEIMLCGKSNPRLANAQPAQPVSFLFEGYVNISFW